MAELVQSNVEDMLAEVYELQQHGIFSPGEAKSIIKTRTSYEYKVRRRISRKNDYIRFIDYELKLEKLKRLRIKQFGITDISEGCRYRGMQRIHFIFQKSLKKFKTDIKLWMKYIEYCKSIESERSLGLAFVQAIKCNPNNSVLWIMSAKHELEVNKNMSAARTIFLRAIKINPDEEKLWLEYFRMELLNVEKARKREAILQGVTRTEESTLSPDFIDFKTVKIVFKNAFNTLKMNALQSFVEVAKLCEGTDSLIQFMFEHALKTKSDLPNVWISLAEYILSKDSQEKCIAILKAAITTIKSSTMLCKVAEFLITKELADGLITDILPTVSLVDSVSVINLLKLCLDSGMTAFDLTGVMTRAISQFPGDKALWIFKLQNLSTDIKADYKIALSSVTDNAELWQGYLRYLSITETTDFCKSEWQTGLKASAGPKLAPLYFEWIFAEEGLESVRKEYEFVSGLHPISEEMILTRIKLEEAEHAYSNVFVLCEALCANFSNAKNWTLFINHCRAQSPKKLTSIMWKAKQSVGEAGLAGL